MFQNPISVSEADTTSPKVGEKIQDPVVFLSKGPGLVDAAEKIRKNSYKGLTEPVKHIEKEEKKAKEKKSKKETNKISKI